MWGATILLLIAASGVMYFDGLIAGCAVTALGSAVLLATLRFTQQRALLCEPARILEAVDGGDQEFEFSLQQKAS